MVSVDLLDPWDPLDWLEPLVSLDVRYDETMASENIYCCVQVNRVSVSHQLTCCVFLF